MINALHVVLINPEIHWNTGNAGRSCLAAGAQLHLVEPLGFSLNDRAVRRAGLDYWQYVQPRVWKNLAGFEEQLPSLGSPVLFTTKAEQLYWDVDLTGAVVLVFGRETGGLPDELRKRFESRLVRIPMHSSEVRSLNLSTSVALGLYEALRQRSRQSRS